MSVKTHEEESFGMKEWDFDDLQRLLISIRYHPFNKHVASIKVQVQRKDRPLELLFVGRCEEYKVHHPYHWGELVTAGPYEAGMLPFHVALPLIVDHCLTVLHEANDSKRWLKIQRVELDSTSWFTSDPYEVRVHASEDPRERVLWWKTWIEWNRWGQRIRKTMAFSDTDKWRKDPNIYVEVPDPHSCSLKLVGIPGNEVTGKRRHKIDPQAAGFLDVEYEIEFPQDLEDLRVEAGLVSTCVVRDCASD